MKKRLAVVAITAVTALGAVASASGAIYNRNYGPNPNAPGAAQCGMADLACTAPSGGRSAPIMSNNNNNQVSTHGSGYTLTRSSASSSTPMTGARTTLG